MRVDPRGRGAIGHHLGSPLPGLHRRGCIRMAQRRLLGGQKAKVASWNVRWLVNPRAQRSRAKRARA
eukprot:8785786-Alexandrium_andersonii.AAC.1